MKMDGKSNAAEIATHLADVRARIAKAAERASRRVDDICLIAVSKTKPPALIEAAALARQRDFGENYVQEALLKKELRPDLRWHLIGALQTNKVRNIVGAFHLIHSVDRLKLAKDIAAQSERAGMVQDILLQVHIGGEENKSGTSFADAPKLIEEILRLPNLRLCGLMSLPPLTDDEKQARTQFSQLREAMRGWQALLPNDQRARFRFLSMGTSSDYEWAILEGATHVRVGTAIFGAREQKGTV